MHQPLMISAFPLFMDNLVRSDIHELIDSVSVFGFESLRFLTRSNSASVLEYFWLPHSNLPSSRRESMSISTLSMNRSVG